MTRRRSKFGFLFLVILALCLLSSTAVAKQLPVRLFTSADGLGSSFVNYLARDSRGFMWFCTRDGLSRFDGLQFVTYQIGEENAQPGIESIFEASDGTYWITTTAGTYRLDPRQVSTPSTTFPTLRAEHVFDDRGIHGDFTGDGKADIAFWRPSTGEWFVQRSEDSSYYSFPFGTSGDIASAADFDGDGKADPAVFRPSIATWFINRSTHGVLIQGFGTNGDIPTTAAFIP